MADFLMKFRARIARTPEGEGAPGGGAADPGAADPGAGGAGALLTGGDPGAQAAPGAGGEGSTKWWEDGKRFDEGTRTMLTAKGLTMEDPADAMAKLAGLYTNAEKRLGKPADQIMDKPGKDQSVTDWMRANGEMFGIPEAAEKYELKRPDSWPKEQTWDDAAEGKLRTKAHELGLSSAQAQGMVDLYAETVMGLQSSAGQDIEQAQAKLRTELQKDWGDQTPMRVARAQQAWQAAAEAAGLDADASLNAAAALSEKAGDPNVLRIFDALGEMMGEDVLTRIPGGGGGGMGMSPAEARAELAAMQRPDSDYAKAVAAKRQGRTPADWQQLNERRAFLTKLAAGE